MDTFWLITVGALGGWFVGWLVEMAFFRRNDPKMGLQLAELQGENGRYKTQIEELTSLRAQFGASQAELQTLKGQQIEGAALTKSNAALSANLEASRSRVAALESQLKQVEGATQVARDRGSQEAKTAEGRMAALAASEAKLAALEAQSQANEAAATALKAQLAASEAQNQQSVALQAELSPLQAEVRELRGRLGQLTLLEKQLATSQAELARYQPQIAELDALRLISSKAAFEAQDSQEKLKQLEAAVKNGAARAQEIDRQNQAMIDGLRAQLEAGSDVAGDVASDVTSEMQAAQAENERLKGQLREQSEIAAELNSVREQLSIVREQLSIAQSQAEAVAAAEADKAAQLAQAQSALASAQAEMAAAQAAASQANREESSELLRLRGELQAVQEQNEKIKVAVAQFKAQADEIDASNAREIGNLKRQLREQSVLMAELNAAQAELATLQAAGQAAPAVAAPMALGIAAPLQTEALVAPSPTEALDDLQADLQLSRQEIRALRGQLAVINGKSSKDDLELIDGIGLAHEKRLYEGGVLTFAALAAMTPEAVREIIQPKAWQQLDLAAWIIEAGQFARGEKE
jgi:predicted flap endonuclease-1-like 5' DNA nuclease